MKARMSLTVSLTSILVSFLLISLAPVLASAPGSPWAWGWNNYGQIGDGTTIQSVSPVQVQAIGSGVTAVAAGGYHNLALKSDGSLWAWGLNSNGQLGSGTTTNLYNPAQIMGPGSGVTGIAAGASHTLATKSDGSLWAWGYNYHGQLGDGTTTGSNTPVQIMPPGSGATGVAGGGSHSLALKSDGSLWAWGLNNYGQLGDGTTTNLHTPVQIMGAGSGIIAIAAGAYHSLAIKSDGSLWAWGYNYWGQVGDATNTQSNTPVQIMVPGSGVTAIAAGYYHSLAVKSDGSLWAWGLNNYGQLGDGTTTGRNAPTQIMPPGSGLTAVAAGANHTLAAKSDGSLWASGSNGYGQLGDGTTANHSSPVQIIPAGSDVTATAAGAYHSLAIKSGNQPPLATNDSYSTSEDSPSSVAAPGVLGNDTDPNGDAFTAVLVSAPVHGAVTLNPNGSFVYVPDANFNGTDSFVYRANDGQDNSNPGTVTIAISPVNDAPIAHSQTVTTIEDTARTVTLLASDVDGDTLKYAVVSQPAKGVLSGAAPNLTYTPNPNLNGSDSFTFRVNDGTVDSSLAAVSITMTAVNDAPTITSLTASTKFLWPADGKPASVTLSGSATDPDGQEDIARTAYSVADEYGQYNVAETTLPAGGALSLIADRDGNDPDGRLYTITVKVYDAGGLSDAASIVVTVPHNPVSSG